MHPFVAFVELECIRHDRCRAPCAMAEVINGIYPIEQVQSKCRSGLQILNWVCPECGGRMGGHGSEFKCHGECQIDWRQLWEQVLAAGRPTKVPSMQRL